MLHSATPRLYKPALLKRLDRSRVLDGTGTVTQEIRPEYDYFYLDYCQPLRSETGDPWALRLTISGTRPAVGEKLTLDGRSLFRDEAWMALMQDDCTQLPPLRYQSCHYDWVETTRHRVQFEGGEITLSMHLPQIDATVYGLFSRAEGVLDGVAFAT